ncbi:hypothetical protein BN1723_020453, partial [Verticillium longisporum]
RGSHFILR